MKATVPFSYPKNVYFVCSKCGLCCGDTPNKIRHVLLLPQEAKRIAANIKCSVESFASVTPENTPYVFEIRKNSETGMCLFLKDNRCTIYEQRPLVCRFYPFELTTDEHGLFVFKETEECPGVSKGKSKGGRKVSERLFAELLSLAQREVGKASC